MEITKKCCKNRILMFFCIILIVLNSFIACLGPAASTYTVVFQTNGGSPVPETQIVVEGNKVKNPGIINKTGYGFGGWYKDWTLTYQWNFAKDTVINNIILYAKWDIDYYTVDFEAYGGVPAPSQQNIVYGGKVITPPIMLKTGYAFGGWYGLPPILRTVN